MQVMTWSSNAFMIFYMSSAGGVLVTRGGVRVFFSIFNVTVSSSFGLQLFGSIRLMSVREAGILGSSKLSNFGSAGMSWLAQRTRETTFLMRLEATVIISSLHLLTDDLSMKNWSWSVTCSLAHIGLKPE